MNDDFLMQLLKSEVSQGSTDINVYSALAQLYLEKGKAGEARELLANALALGINDASIYDLIAIANIQLGRNIVAEVEIRRAIEIRPDDAFLYKRLGHLLRMMDRDKEALDAFKKSFAMAPSPDVQEEIQELSRRLEEYIPISLALFQKALDTNPNSSLSWLGLASCMVSLGKYDEAITSLKKALTINPRDFDVACKLAYLFAIQAKYEDAIRYYEGVIVEEPLHIGALRELGQVHEILGNIPKASEIYMRVAKLEGSK